MRRFVTPPHSRALGLLSAVLLALPALSATLSGAQAAPAAKDKPEQSKAAPAASVLTEDQGKFRILLDGQPVGSEEFEISRANENWRARGTTVIHPPGGDAMRVTVTQLLAADGSPLRYDWAVQAQKKTSAVVDFRGSTARIEAQLGGREPYVQTFTFPSPRVAILDNNVYHHYALLARRYDWNARGTQTFPVLIPQGPVPGSITVQETPAQEIAGTRLEVLRVTTTDIEVNLYLDANHRLIRLAVPAAKVEVIRE